MVTLIGFDFANRGQCEVPRVLKLYKEIPLLKEQTGEEIMGGVRERRSEPRRYGGLGGTLVHGWEMESTFRKRFLGREDGREGFPRNTTLPVGRTMTNELDLEAAEKNWQSVENPLPGLGEL